MRETLQSYRSAIAEGSVNPLVHWDGRTNGLIFDPASQQTPLSLLAFGACRLESAAHRIETGRNECALVPVEGQFEIRVGPEVFRVTREGGPFAVLPGASNACAIYAPAGAIVEVSGRGELVYFMAPAAGHKPPAMVPPGQRPNLPRGAGIWYREVVTLFTPDDVSTVLVGGETYSPPGLWSGTPLHVHDEDDAAAGESDHEEVYFHLARNRQGDWGPYGVQLLFDDRGLDKAYMIHDRDAFAIPGAAHPVVAGPNSDMLYIWCLAGPSAALRMRDVPEFAYLKKVGMLLDEVLNGHPRRPLSAAEFRRLVQDSNLDDNQAHVLRMHLRQQGIEVQG